MDIKKERIVVFYSYHELDVKDVENELFTDDKENFHFFFFNNKNLHFSKTNILKQVLFEKFSTITPEFSFAPEQKAIYMKKKFENFDFKEFDEEVNREFKEYTSRINYRVDCIFQTFTLFYELYRDKALIFVFPMQLYTKFLNVIEEKGMKIEELSKINNLVRRYDIFHWINYYTRSNAVAINKDTISYRNVVKILHFKN